MNKIVLVSMFLLVISTIVLVATRIETDDNEEVAQKLYYGPVQEGYNETHFRLTGEYIKEVGA